MTTPRDPDLRLRAYLDDGPTELPVHSYEAVDARIARTRQRVVIGPRRNLRMSSPGRLLSLAAVVILVVIGVSIIRAPWAGPAVTPSPSTIPSPTLMKTPSPSLPPGVYRWPGALPAGTYDTVLAYDEGPSFHFTVGDGWRADGVSVATRTYRAGVWFLAIESVGTIPCRGYLSSAATSDDVVRALAKVVTFDAEPISMEIGGRKATYVEFTVAPPDCIAGGYWLFGLPALTCPVDRCASLGSSFVGVELGPTPNHWRLWVMDVGTRAVAVAAIWVDAATSQELAALQDVIDSFRLDTPLATPAPQPSTG